MFTGLIEEVGTLVDRIEVGTSLRLHFKAERVLSDLKIDDSIAVNGCCQTVVGLQPSGFEVIAVRETLEKTTLGSLTIGEEVNLERAAMLSARLGGHLVQGHIDGVAEVAEIIDLQGSWEYYFHLPERFLRYIVPQGSITINGVSLTVAAIAGSNLNGSSHDGSSLKVAIIPHTYEVTTFHSLHKGDKVNIEVDVIAKMVERMTSPHLLSTPA